MDEFVVVVVGVADGIYNIHIVGTYIRCGCRYGSEAGIVVVVVFVVFVVCVV